MNDLMRLETERQRLVTGIIELGSEAENSGKAIEKIMDSGTRAVRTFNEALSAATTKSDIQDIEAALAGLGEAERSAVREAGIYNQLMEKRKAIFGEVNRLESELFSLRNSQDNQQGSQQAQQTLELQETIRSLTSSTHSLGEETGSAASKMEQMGSAGAKAAQEIIQAFNSIPDVTVNLELKTARTPQQLQTDLQNIANKLDIQVPVKLTLNQQELSRFTRMLQDTIQKSVPSVKDALLTEVRKRG